MVKWPVYDASLVCDLRAPRRYVGLWPCLPEETSARYADGQAALMRSVIFHPLVPREPAM